VLLKTRINKGAYMRKSQMLEVAEIARKSFVQGKRQNSDTTYWHTVDSAPEWVKDMCQDAHDGMLPDDYRYEFIVESLDAIIDAEGDTDNVELEADCYTADLTAWLASRVSRTEYVDQAAEEFGSASKGIVAQLMQGQYLEKREVASSVISSLESVNLEDDE
jgi:hypothetical protein